jgi:phosphocarrier protein HPr
MFQEETLITNPTGLHARPAAQLTKFCKDFPENITIIAGTNYVNPKSIISILAAGMKRGSSVTIQVEGENERDVGEQLIAFLRNLTD